MYKDQGRKDGKKNYFIRGLFSDEKVGFNTRLVGTLFIALSGILLYLDRVLAFAGIDSDVNYGFTTFYNFIWVLTQSVAPILLIIGSYFQPYKSAFLIAIYCYAVQIIWIFNPQYYDDLLFTLYSSFGLVIIILAIIVLINKIIQMFNQRKSENQEFIDDTKEVLEILKAKVLNTNTKAN